MAATPLPNMDIKDSFKDALNSTSGAYGGTIKTGMIFNTSGVGHFGLVKMLALGAFGLIAYKILRKGK